MNDFLWFIVGLFGIREKIINISDQQIKILNKIEPEGTNVYRFDDILLVYIDLEEKGLVKRIFPDREFYRKFKITRRGKKELKKY